MPIESAPHPTPYSPLQYQLVLEIYVSSLQRSIDFYTSLGFSVSWTYPDLFAQLSWPDDGCLLFLKVKKDDGGNGSDDSRRSGNIRIMIPDVDSKYEECKKLGYTIVQEIGDRLYVLRDFIVHDPDGFEVRFGSFLENMGRLEQEKGWEWSEQQKKL
ncbi:hypothetical protein FQN52_007917 [Onygenales sp. PD_12]|nr:hypothetical protein FQN53_007498 [Emmonsiellopsis sp. PD_33]KAK2786172.1 hypothetical protein FQN52_007917 [Onygenales sp. PD_12]